MLRQRPSNDGHSAVPVSTPNMAPFSRFSLDAGHKIDNWRKWPMFCFRFFGPTKFTKTLPQNLELSLRLLELLWWLFRTLFVVDGFIYSAQNWRKMPTSQQVDWRKLVPLWDVWSDRARQLLLLPKANQFEKSATQRVRLEQTSSGSPQLSLPILPRDNDLH